MVITRRHVLTGLSALPFLAATRPHAQTAAIPVVATFSVLADITKNVGGDRIAIDMLVGQNADAHVYRPTPADGRKLAEARVIVTNGIGFEGFMSRLVRSSGTKARVITASEGIDRIAAQKKDDHGHSHGHSHGAFDPHAWQSVAAVRRYAVNIRDGLSAADPAGAQVYAANAAAYDATLAALDAELKAAAARIPQARRRIVTGHNAFQYLGRDLGLTFVGIQGVSTEQAPSARDVARIIQQIRRERISAVFIENLTDQRLVEQVARETGAVVGGALISDALTPPDGVAPTYERLMRHNVAQLTKALVPAA
jgi:zinc/manganese transport system substrate-binding protein